MVDPVLAPDGHSYERQAIEEWIEEHGTSPQTRQPMQKNDLVPNRVLLDLILEYESEEKKQIMEKFDKGVSSSTNDDGTILQLASENIKATIRHSSYNDSESLVSIQTPNYEGGTMPSHICCVLDVSGSMSVPAKSKDEHGNVNESNLSVLDVVKFATLVISQTCSATDQLSIVKYSSSSEVVLRPTYMNDQGKAAVKKALSSIRASGSTNLWSGIKSGVELCHSVSKEYINSVFVLTDGCPNVDPPLGYERSMKKLLKKEPFLGSLSTFGFGYSLDSPLLSSIAHQGGGHFSFIPDAGFVGTCFINAIANARCVFGLNPVLQIHGLVGGEEDTNDVTMDGQLDTYFDDASNAVCVRMSPLRFGVSNTIVLNKQRLGNNIDIDIVYEVPGSPQVVIPIDYSNTTEIDPNLDAFHSVRAKFTKTVNQVIKHQQYEASFIQQLEPSQEVKSSTNDSIKAICMDMSGQAKEAVSTQSYYNRWGRHYLFSLSDAHLHQICNNFKDPGVQLYGKGKLFISLQETLDDVFDKIPPPEPSIPPVQSSFGSTFAKKESRSSSRNYAAARNIQTMSSAFNNRNSVCVGGGTELTVKYDNNVIAPKKISDIKKGDKVLAVDGQFVKVQCLVKTTITNTMEIPFHMVRIGNLVVTHYHPIRINNSKSGWQFPIDIPHGQEIIFDSGDDYSVFNLILEEGKRHCPLWMDGVECITLGHGIINDAVLKHVYFGTDCVVTDLKTKVDGWNEGLICLREVDIHRDETSGEICGISRGQASIIPVM